jgi:mannosyl-oligosaccharide alpha-1,2-mannosidase
MYPSLALALAAAAPASAALIQIPGLQVPKNYASNTNVVRQMFNTSYQTYSKYAYGHDDLSPLSLSYNDPRNGAYRSRSTGDGLLMLA